MSQIWSMWAAPEEQPEAARPLVLPVCQSGDSRHHGVAGGLFLPRVFWFPGYPGFVSL